MLTLLLAATLTASAHDYWLDPQPTSLPEGGGELSVHLLLGQQLATEEDKPYLADRTVSFEHIQARGRASLAAVDGAVPAWTGTLRTPGGHLFALERNAAWIELEADRFHDYLTHEGLQHVQAARLASGEQEAAGRERYTRYLKAWVPVGATPDEVHSVSVGHTLELRLLDRPSAAAPLRVAVEFEGRPLAGHSLTAYVRRADAPDAVLDQALITDAAGQVEFPAAAAGDWLVRTVHMRRCVDCPKADWQSFWAAYRFEVTASEAAAAGAVAPEAPASGAAEVVPAGSSEAPARTCGCVSTSPPAAGWLVLLGVWAVRRGRQRLGAS